MSDSQLRQQFIRIVQRRALKFGQDLDIKLKSNKHSNHYIDLRAVLMDPTGATLAGLLLWEPFISFDANFVGGMETEAIPIVSAILQQSQLRAFDANGFWVRKADKEHGLSGRIAGLDVNNVLRQKRVVLVEGTMTSGGSTKEAVEVVRSEGGIVVGVVALVDREQGGENLFASLDIPFVSVFKAKELFPPNFVLRTWDPNISA